MFIIMASSGEYSDRDVWATAVFSKESRAEVEAIVVRKTKELNSARIAYESWYNELHKDEPDFVNTGRNYNEINEQRAALEKIRQPIIEAARKRLGPAPRVPAADCYWIEELSEEQWQDEAPDVWVSINAIESR